VNSAVQSPRPQRTTSEEQWLNFSLVQGGPTYRMWQRLHVLRPPLHLATRRALYIPLLAWLPLAILVEVTGSARANLAMPFLLDFEHHVRFLIALPLLIVGEVYNELYLRNIIRQFPERRIIVPEDFPHFNAVLSSTYALRDSVWPETAFLLLVYIAGPFLTIAGTPNTSTWYATVGSGGIHYTAAGRWLVLVSIPLFQFILLR